MVAGRYGLLSLTERNLLTAKSASPPPGIGTVAPAGSIALTTAL
jgi:hypothetical protein